MSEPTQPCPAILVSVVLGRGSYDRVLGARSLCEQLPGDGLDAGMSCPNWDGDRVVVYRAFDNDRAAPPTGPHAYRQQANHGRNDGFVLAHQEAHAGAAETEPMSYLARQHVPTTWALADAYTICDRWFASEDDVDWWRCFEEESLEWRMHRFDCMDELASAAACGALPTATVIDATELAVVDGQDLLRRVHGVLAGSPRWSDTLLVITCADHGGFYDHVPHPGPTLGFRVPTIVAGPLARRAHVSSAYSTHRSFVRSFAALRTGRVDATMTACLDPSRVPGVAPRCRRLLTGPTTARHAEPASFSP